MRRVITDNVWQQISPLLQNTDKLIAALAYVSTSQFVSFSKGDILICDASDNAISSGETSAAVLSKFHKSGAAIYSCQNLHAKVMVFGQNVLIGSCNLSESSAYVLRELAVLSNDASTRSQALAFMHTIKSKSTLVDSTFLKRISNIPVSKRRGGLRIKRPSIQLGNRTWIIRTYHLNSERYSAEAPLVEKAEKEVKKNLRDPDADISWVRWTGKNTFRSLACAGDTIIELSSPRKSNRIVVSSPAAILKRQDHDKWTRFYYENQEDTMSWTSFERELRKIGITQIKKNSTKELTPRNADLVSTIWR